MIKVNNREGKSHKLTISGKTLAQFVAEVAEVVGVKPSALQLLTGYPPVLFVSDVPEAPLPMDGIKSGETVIVQEGSPPSLTVGVSIGQLVSLGFETENAKEALEIGKKCGADLELAVEIALSLTGDLSMSRHVIAADNNCLFSAILFAIEGSALSTTAHRTPLDLRLAISSLCFGKNSVFDESISEAILGKTPEEYSMWISNQDTWGGEIEMSLICNHLLPQLCIRAVEISSGTVYSYNQEAAVKVIYLLYDGIHFDLLTRKLEVNGVDKVVEQCLFNPTDLVKLDRAALLVASEARRARQFVDTGNFSLRCLVCQAGLKGQTDAQQHAKSTGHTNFAEY